MRKLEGIEPRRMFEYFEEICSIPRGSGDMGAISRYLVEFAENNGLRSVLDVTQNVIIYKDGTAGFENAEPIILQAHMDMVCQKTPDSTIDFKKDGLDIYTDGDFIKARGTTLGADNGIAVAMIMSILTSEDLSHPPIEAVFTTDEEIGMIGAGRLDVGLLRGRRMINLDAEEADFVTVSCAGGSDFKIRIPTSRQRVSGTSVTIEVGGLLGGHSGVEIDKGRVNSNILLGRVLGFAEKITRIDIIDISGGDKANAIPLYSRAELVVDDADGFCKQLEQYFEVIKAEIKKREPDCYLKITAGESGKFDAFTADISSKMIYMLSITPNGIETMSAEIEGLVETSLNLGILATDGEEILMQYALRSNKKSALRYLEDKLTAFAEYNSCRVEISGQYEPWEYREKSPLRDLYIKTFYEKMGREPEVSAIHAGLECAVFSAKISDLDCIAIGPDMTGVHTTGETLSISSAKMIYELLCETIAQMD